MRCIVVHPEGDRSVVQVLSLSRVLREGLASLVTATRCVFEDDKHAEAYALDLAAQNRLRYEAPAQPVKIGVLRA